MNRRSLLLSTLLVLTPLPGAAQGPRIVVGPEILVSRDGPGAHVELMLATNPRNAGNMVGGAITATRPDGGSATKVYATVDGGQTWHDSRFVEQMRWGGADPQVAFTPHGTALFATLTSAPDETGRDRGFMHVYRSEDGGLNWSEAIDLRYSWDHPQLTVDHTVGAFGGRAYIGVLYGYPVYRIGVFRSNDDGRSWIGPAEAANGAGEKGINVANLLVTSDGALLVPYADFEFLPEKRSDEPVGNLWLVASEDGGITFSSPRKVAETRGRSEGRYGSFPQFAIDNRSDNFRDRLYATWTDFRSGEPRVVVTRSADRGNTWSEPKAVAAGPTGSYQFQPAIAVGDSGVVALTFFDTRGQPDRDTYHQYVTASLDGGLTWLEPVRVSTTSSHRYAAGNMTYTPLAWRTRPDSMRITFLSPASRWGNGGDYMGLAADRNGVFHPFWTDSRYGSFQVMTAAVRVVNGPAGATPAPATREEDVTPSVAVLFDPARYDGTTHTASLFIRLSNTGTRPLYGPLELVVRSFGSGLGEELRDLAPTLLNADNGAEGDGAIFRFDDALGSDGVLEPGEVSGPIEIRARVQDPLRVPDMHVGIRGRVPR